MFWPTPTSNTYGSETQINVQLNFKEEVAYNLFPPERGWNEFPAEGFESIESKTMTWLHLKKTGGIWSSMIFKKQNAAKVCTKPPQNSVLKRHWSEWKNRSQVYTVRYTVYM